MIRINKNITIKQSELTFKFVRSSGPGGQNVNKVSTAVQLRFDITASVSLTDYMKSKLMAIGGRRVTKEGVLVIEANRFRTQEKNRQDAIARLIVLIDKSSQKVKRRIGTNPTAASNQKRIEVKRRLSEKKKMRRYLN